MDDIVDIITNEECDDTNIEVNQHLSTSTFSGFSSSGASHSRYVDGDETKGQPFCESYSDLEESLRLSPHTTKMKHKFLNWFYNSFIISTKDEKPNPNLASNAVDTLKSTSTVWSLNYREAAIYLEEGFNNDKFDYHPYLFSKLPVYLAVHNHFYYSIDLFGCLLILILAVFEKPAVDGYHFPELIHASMELFGLLIISIVFWIKFYWIGPRHFFKHRRTMIKTIVLCLMIIEAIVVLIRQDSHFRVTRSLRPVFLIDNHYFHGVRRVIRQTILSLKSFALMLLLLSFLLLLFSISAFYMFSPISNYDQFSTFEKSVLSLFVLLTTANFPDVMMPAYKMNKLYVVFFVVYLVLNLYLVLNIMLAEIYSSFSNFEKEKFRKLFLHRRNACHHAFRLLVTRTNPNQIELEHFNGLMEHLKPNTSQLERYLMFKALIEMESTVHPCQHRNTLTLNNFYNIYEVIELKWTNNTVAMPWFDNFACCCRGILFKLRYFVLHNSFNYFIYFVIFVSLLYQIFVAIYSQEKWQQELFQLSTLTISTIFIGIYTIEMFLKLLALGPCEYFKNWWNIFDSIVAITALIALIWNQYSTAHTLSISIYSFRSIKLILFLRENVDQFDKLLGPFVFIIIKRFSDLILVVIILYYFFAIIAMECFGGYNLQNCCHNTTIENYFKTNGTTTSYYYLNNFNDIITSYITLFELMVVNNWQIPMAAYRIVTNSDISMLFFCIFYLISLVVITITIAFVLDSFNFQIQYRNKFGKDDESVKVSIKISLTENEFNYFENNSRFVSNSIVQYLCPKNWSMLRVIFRGHNSKQIPYSGNNINVNELDIRPVLNIETGNQCLIHFCGTRIRDKFSYNNRMYSSEIQKWLE